MNGVRVVIAAAGPQTKWGNHLGVPSHLVPVDGRPLLARTIAQVREWCEDIHVTVPAGDWRYRLAGAVLHERDGNEPSEYAATRDLWNPGGRTILLLGDVWWSDQALAVLWKRDERGYRAFGRYGPSTVSGCRYGELFGISWWPADHAQLDQHLDTVHGLRAEGTVTRPPGWMLLRAMQGTPLHLHQIRRPPFVDLPDDGTDDIDTPADWRRHPAFGRRR